jgi:hypothetical protein
VLIVPAAATALARWRLGADAPSSEVDVLGYGWPALEAARWWTPITGAVVSSSLVIPLLPSYTFVAVALQEHRARHWRTAVTLVGGQVGGMLLGLLLMAPLRGVDSDFARAQTTTIDFGISVGGFACLGAWTAYLSASWRRPLRVGISAYLLCQLLFSGLIFDVSHPLGWTIGIVAGHWLVRPHEVDRTPISGGPDRAWIALGLAVGTAVGLLAAWNAGGVGGLLGWGP